MSNYASLNDDTKRADSLHYSSFLPYAVATVVGGGWKYSFQAVLQRMPGFSSLCSDSAESFNKPVFLTFTIFLGMMCTGFKPAAYLKDYRKLCKREDYTKITWLLLAMVFLGIIGDIGSVISTMYLDAALAEMLTAIMKTVFVVVTALTCRGHRFGKTHFMSLALLIIGCVFLIFANTQEASSENLFVAYFCAIIVCPVAVGGKIVIAEWLSHDYAIPGYLMLVATGVYGCIISMLLIPVAHFIPGDDCGRFEDMVDSFQKFGGYLSDFDTVIFLYVCIIIYSSSQTLREFGGFQLVLVTTATDRCVWDFFRGAVTWFTDIIIYYTWGHAYDIGESFSYSTILLVIGYTFGFFGTKLFYSEPYQRVEGANEATLGLTDEPETSIKVNEAGLDPDSQPSEE